MKTIRRIVLAACLAFGPQAAFAQWTFSVTFHVSGECATREERTAIDNANNIWQTQVIPAMQQAAMTRAECERMRSYIESILNAASYRDRYCSIYWTVGPCVGKDPPKSESVLGPSQGSSYFSPNPADEVINWAGDVKIRETILVARKGDEVDYEKTQRSLLELKNYIQRKQMFSSIGLPEGTVQEMRLKPSERTELINYLEDKELLLNLVQKFYQLTEVNIVDLYAKTQRTEEEERVISVFMEWTQQTLKNLEKAKNMAIISALEYDDADKSLACNTTYKMINSGQVPDEPVQRLSKLIEMCNNEPLNQGFHADLFYDETTGEYAVSFRGTESADKTTILIGLTELVVKTAMKNAIPGLESAGDLINRWLNDLAEGNTDKLPPDLHDIATDASQGLGEVLTQYKMAIEIADVIRQIQEKNPDIKINITGHSLGGGLGIVAGVVSGSPTYVFNPAGVHENTFDYAGVSDKVKSQQYNITRFSTDDDPLTNIQEPSSTKWGMINTGVKSIAKHAAENQNLSESDVRKITAKALPRPAGNKVTMNTNKGHSIDPMARKMIHYVEVMKRSLKRRGEEISSCNIYFDE